MDPGTNPLYGFEVRDGYPVPEPQKITVQNASGIETTLVGMDLMVLSKEEDAAFPLEDLNTSFFENSSEWNSRWVPVPSYLLPTHSLVGDGGIDSFFDVYLAEVPDLPVLPPEGVLLARQHSEYSTGTKQGTEDFWQYELHEAHTPEPATWVLLIFAGLGALVLRRRRI